jgi:hypothetical protein
MKKWLSLIVMSCILFGAAYVAIATEQGRKLMKKSENARALLAEIDALLANDSQNIDLLNKRAIVAQSLADQGVTVSQSDSPEVKDADYLRSLGMSEEDIQKTLGTPANVTPEKIKDEAYYRANGMFDQLDVIEQETEATNQTYLEMLLEREQQNLPLTESEKIALVESGLLDMEYGRDPYDNLDDVGGPSASFGYRWVDNLNGDTASFVWDEADVTWTELTEMRNADDTPLDTAFWGWNFSFFGTSYTQAFVSSNGYLIFGTLISDLSNECRRAASSPNVPMIMAFWDDLHTGRGPSSDSGRVVMKDFGDHVTITWDSVGTCCTYGQDLLDYQVQLWNDGKIKLQYRQVQKLTGTSTNGQSPTIGISQSANSGGGDSLIYYCSTVADSAHTNHLDGRAVWFYQLFLDNDFSCDAVIEPNPLRVSPGEVFDVIGRFRNSGNVTQSAPVSYQFNGGAIVTEATGVLSLNQSEDHNFAGTVTAPLAVGDYPLVLWTGLATDEDNTNDTCRVTVQVRECFDAAAPNDAFSVTGTTCGALNDWANTCLGSADASEEFIYQWTTTSNSSWNLQLVTTLATTRGLLVSTACPPDSFNCVTFLNQFQDTLSLNCVPLAAGTYYIMIDRSSGCDGFTLNVTECTDIGRCCYNNNTQCADLGAYDCSALSGNWDRTTTCAQTPCPQLIDGGETCADAVLLAVPFSVRSATTGHLDDDPGFTCESNFNGDDYVGSNTAEDVWYKIVGTGNTITVSLCAAFTSYDSQILVTCSADCQNFTCVGGNDDAFTAGCAISSSRSIEWFCSEVGREYFIVVDGWSTADGNFELSISDDGIPCTGAVDCSPLGRCCYLDGGVPMCTDNQAADCALLGGQWDDLTNCASNPCPVARCCYDDNGTPACTDNTELQCIALAGVWSANLSCATNPCPTFLQGTEECVDAPELTIGQEVQGTTAGYNLDATLITCGTTLTSAPGVWLKVIGNGDSLSVTTCAGDVFEYDTKLGVFCGSCDNLLCVAGDDDDTCPINGLYSRVRWCSELGRTYFIYVTGFSTNSGTYHLVVNDEGPCLGNPPDCTLEGRCCYLDAGNPVCEDLLIDDCSTLGGLFNANFSCATDPCPIGRCCYLDGGAAACADNTEIECNALGGDWTSGVTCASDPCPLGRCCYDNNGTPACANNIELECQALAGLWDGTLDCNTACPTILLGADECVDAVPVPSYNQQFVGTADGYLGETALPVCASWYNTNTPPAVWYSFMGTGNTVTVSLCDALSTYDSEIGIFCGADCQTLECVASSDDFCGLQSEITFCSVQNAEYKLMISAFSALSTPPFNYAFTITDDGIPCEPTVVCPVTVTCEPVADLAAYVVAVGSLGDHLQLHFTAPQDASYQVWYSTNPNNDGNPDNGADPDFVLENTITGVLQNAAVVYDSPDPWANFRYYVVTADCTPPALAR